MFDKFADYMYYLLTSPFKKIGKPRNQWYKLMKVLGKRFDDALEGIYLARDQTAVATCDPDMLQFHAEDRGITRYAGELDENFRVRIANYTEILKLGGTNAGILLAVRSLGFENVELVPAKIYASDADRWAEFYILLRFGIDDTPPIALTILRKQVRRVKEVGAKDNYSYQYRMSISHENSRMSLAAVRYLIHLAFFPHLALDGSWKLDGSRKLNSRRKQYPVVSAYKLKVVHDEQISRVVCHEEHKLFKLDGSWKLDGSRKLDAWQRTEEL